MKKMSRFICVILLLILLCGCSSIDNILDEYITSSEEATEITTTEEEKTLKLEKIRSICSLVSLKCEYHNVAKSIKEAGSGIMHIGEKERKFWIEYDGEAEISYDANKIDWEQDGDSITIVLPSPEIKCRSNPDSMSSPIEENDNLIQKNPITIEDKTKAINEAEEKMKEKIENNSSILSTAKDQAKAVIENYISQIGKINNRKYTVSWEEASKDEGQ